MLAASWPVGAWAQIPCSINQITSTVQHFNFGPRSNADGTLAAFLSTADLAGANSAGNLELFLFDAVANDFTQVTSPPSNPSFVVFAIFSPDTFTADGSSLVFSLPADLTGQNPELNWEVFLYDLAADQLTQLTDAPSGESLSPAVSDDGSRIAFLSSADLTGGNGDGSFEVFLYETATAALSQVTFTSGGSEAGPPTINASGTRIAFHSDADLTGGNADGNNEIFLYAPATGVFSQITSSVLGSSESPAMSDAGTRIAFESSADHVGTNADGSTEVFLYDGTVPAFTQISDAASPAIGISQRSSISADGNRVAFQSNADLVGINADGGAEIFSYDHAVGSLTQLTNSPDLDSSFPNISGDGSRVYFHSNADLTGLNPFSLLNTEIFSVETTTVVITQVTVTQDAIFSSSLISGSGERLAFTSTADLTGANPDGSLEVFESAATVPAFEPVTDTPDGVPSLATAIDADGNRLVFTSPGDHIGSNLDGNAEVFLYETTSDTIAQITNTTTVENLGVSITDDGALISLISAADLGAGGNPDGNVEVFLYDVAGGFFTQITFTTGLGSLLGLLAGDGSTMVVESSADLTGGNADGNTEIFHYDVAGGLFTQVTDTAGAMNAHSSISGDGRWISFRSDGDPTGQNPDGNEEIFLYDAQSALLTQVTFTSSGNSGFPDLDAAGTRIVFLSDANLPGVSQGSEPGVVIYEVTTGIFLGVTPPSDRQSRIPRLDHSGTRISFLSGIDLTGGNPDGNMEIMVADCPQETLTLIDVPALSPWALLLFSLLLSSAGWIALRRHG